MAVPEGLDQVGTGAREPERRTRAWESGSRSEPAEKEGSGTVCPRWGKSGGGGESGRMGGGWGMQSANGVVFGECPCSGKQKDVRLSKLVSFYDWLCWPECILRSHSIGLARRRSRIPRADAERCHLHHWWQTFTWQRLDLPNSTKAQVKSVK